MPDRYTVAVDFDGVIHSYTSAWVSEEFIPDPPVEGAIEWLNEISRHFTVVIHTTRGRTFEGRAAVFHYLRDHGYTGGTAESGGIKVTHEKIPALVYVDDRGWRFTGPGSFPTVREIHEARPWNRTKT
jgi:hypothetical protein